MPKPCRTSGQGVGGEREAPGIDPTRMLLGVVAGTALPAPQGVPRRPLGGPGGGAGALLRFCAPDGEIGPFRGEAEFLSNRFERPISIFGRVFCCAEGAFQSQKFLDPAMQARFEHLAVGEARRLGKTRHPSFRPDWEAVKEGVMLEVLRAKFSPIEMQRLLAETGTARLVEYNNWGDDEWGVLIRTGRGLNRLGELLMRVRDEIRGGQAPQ